MQNDDNTILCLSCGSLWRRTFVNFFKQMFGAEGVRGQRKNGIAPNAQQLKFVKNFSYGL